MLQRLKKLYERLFPPQAMARPGCPHCGGVRCSSACQFVSPDKTPNGEKPAKNNKPQPG